MPRRFRGRKCRPYEWEGAYALAARSEERDHGFQGLITSILLAELGGQAQPPARGPDGKIDLWIEEGPATSGLFLGPYPAIVECKYHEKTDWDRLLATWAEVRRGLVKAAKQGWVGREKPWLAARRYIYCVSSELDTALRQRLAAKIESDLSRLHRNAGSLFPALTVQVPTWSEVSEWADRFPIVCDQWLGPGSGEILPRAEYLAQFRDDDFRRWLRPELLRFVEPSANAPHHPRKILKLLEERMSKGGVILHGAGGVGKTRTAIEVGMLAESLPKPWRVLHVNAVRGVTTHDLFREIVPGSDQTTLVIYDYIDQAANFVPDDFARRLHSGYPDARIVLLGTARQSRLTGAGRAFRTVTLHPDEHHVDRILKEIRAAMGTPLLDRFSEGMLESIGGRRPVIALLIYDELARRVREGQTDVAHFREALDLTSWLEGRLRGATRLSESDEAEPEHFRLAKRVAAASVFAAAPQTEIELVGVARSALHRAAGGALDALAERIVKKLTELGWLVAHRDELGPAHDVVTDELLEGVLVAEDGTIYGSELDAVLGPATQSSRTLGRMALSFGRLIGDQLRNRAAESHLRRAVASWFERHTGEVAALLGSAADEDGRDRAAYAIGAVLASDAWSTQLLARWDTVVGPWLEIQKAVPEVRHLLYRALQSADTSSSMARNLMRQAAEWVSANYLQRDASFLAVQLIERLDIGTLEPLAPKLGVWLVQHCTSEEARFVIMAVLRRPELPQGLREAAWNAAEKWFEANQHDAAAPAMFRLFTKSRPPGPQSYRARLGLVRAHLARARKTEGRDVDSLLFLLDIGARSDEVAEAVAMALKILDEDVEPPQAAKLVRQLLPLRLRRADHAKVVARAVGFDLSLLQPVDVSFLLEALLNSFSMRSGGDAERRASIDAACRWLQRHRLEREAGRVLAALLRFPLGRWERDVVRTAVRWLPLHVHEREAGSILPPLLRSSILEDRTRAVVSHALEWIHRYTSLPEAQNTIEEIVKQQKQIPERLRNRFARLALDRFLQLGRDRDISYAGRWLAEHLESLPHGQRKKFIETAVDWIESEENDGDREQVAIALLKSVDARNDRWRRVADVMIAAVRRGVDARSRPGVVEALSTRRSLLSDEEVESLRTFVAAEQVIANPRALERLARPQVTLADVEAALSRPEPPAGAFVESAIEEIEDLAVLGLLRRQFRRLPAVAFLLAWRVADDALGQRIVATVRNVAVSDQKLDRQLPVFREHLLAALESIPAEQRPDSAEVLRRAGIDDVRLAMRRALDEVQPAAGIIPAPLFREVVASIESDLASGSCAEAGRLLCRLFGPAARSADEAMIAKVIELCGSVRSASTPEQREVFNRRSEFVVAKHTTPLAAIEILRLFGVYEGSFIEAKMQRHLDEGEGMPSAGTIEAAVAEARQRLARNQRSAAALVAPLLAVAVRSGDAALLETCRDLKLALFPLLDRGPYDEFRIALYAYLQADWPEYSRYRRMLASLGVLEPLVSLLDVADRHVRNGTIPDDLLLYLQNVTSDLAKVGRYDNSIVRVLQRVLMISAHRGGGRMSVPVRMFATSILARVPEAVRSDLARHAYDALGHGYWPDVRAGERDLLELGLQTEEHRVNERFLEEMLFDLARPMDREGLQQQLRLAEERLVEGNIGGAGYLLVPLLPLAARLGDPGFEEQVHGVVERLLSLGSKFERDGIRATSLGPAFHAWPSRDSAELTLQKLGIALTRIVRLVSSEAAITIEDASAAIDGCAKMLDYDASEDAAAPLASVLAAAFRCGDASVKYRARQLVTRFLEASLTRFEELDLFTNGCLRLLREGAWGDPEEAVHCIEDLGIAPVCLETLTADPRLPIRKEMIEPGFRAAKTMVEGQRVRRAEDFLVHLVPLSSRATDEHFTDAVDQLVGRMLIGNKALHRSFFRRSTALLQTAWPDPDAGRERLQRLANGERRFRKSV